MLESVHQRLNSLTGLALLSLRQFSVQLLCCKIVLKLLGVASFDRVCVLKLSKLRWGLLDWLKRREGASVYAQ